jgi:hypothetical protein
MGYAEWAEFRPRTRIVRVGTCILVAALTEMPQALSTIPDCQIATVIALEDCELRTMDHAPVTKAVILAFLALRSIPLASLAPQIFTFRLLRCSSTFCTASTIWLVAVCTHINNHLLFGFHALFLLCGFAA